MNDVKPNIFPYVMHIDLPCNGGPMWQKSLQFLSNKYVFINSQKNSKSIDNILCRKNPTHIVLGGGFWNSRSQRFIQHFYKYKIKNKHVKIIGYWGDARVEYIDRLPKLIFANKILCSSVEAVNKFKGKKINAEFAPHPVDTQMFSYKKDQKKIYDWCFVGTNYGTTRGKYLTHIKDITKKYTVLGQGHKDCDYYIEPEPEDLGFIPFGRTAEIFQSSKIIIDIIDDKFYNLTQYFSDRVPMALACGSFVLTNYRPGLENLFERGVHLDWFTTKEELHEKINKYLDDDKLRQEIAMNGYKISDQFEINKMIASAFG